MSVADHPTPVEMTYEKIAPPADPSSTTSRHGSPSHVAESNRAAAEDATRDSDGEIPGVRDAPRASSPPAAEPGRCRSPSEEDETRYSDREILVVWDTPRDSSQPLT